MVLALWIVFEIKYNMAGYDECLQRFFANICPGHYFTRFYFHITLPCHLTDDSMLITPPLPISIDFRQQTKILQFTSIGYVMHM